MIDTLGTACQIAFKRMSLDNTDYKQTLLQAMACYHEATS